MNLNLAIRRRDSLCITSGVVEQDLVLTHVRPDRRQVFQVSVEATLSDRADRACQGIDWRRMRGGLGQARVGIGQLSIVVPVSAGIV